MGSALAIQRIQVQCLPSRAHGVEIPTGCEQIVGDLGVADEQMDLRVGEQLLQLLRRWEHLAFAERQTDRFEV